MLILDARTCRPPFKKEREKKSENKGMDTDVKICYSVLKQPSWLFFLANLVLVSLICHQNMNTLIVFSLGEK